MPLYRSPSLPYLLKYPELAFHRWARKYGPVYTFVISDQRFVALSDPNVGKDILLTNCTVFSSRKEMFIKVQTILIHCLPQACCTARSRLSG